MLVSQLMNRDVQTCRPNEDLMAAASRMWNSDIGCLPVMSPDNRVVGMITDRDICMAGFIQGKPLNRIPISTAMSREVVSCFETDSVEEAANTMRTHQVRRLPVFEKSGHLVGVLSMNDLVREADREKGRRRPALSCETVVGALGPICEPRHREVAVAAS